MGLLGDLASVGDLVTGWMNYKDTKQANEDNYELAQKNYDLNASNLEWEKQKQTEAWAREDNATQRRVADLKAAGLSPTLAAGSAASSSGPISLGRLEAPQKQVAQRPSMADKVEASLAMRKMDQDIANTTMQRDLMRAQMSETGQRTIGQAIQNTNLAKESVAKDLDNETKKVALAVATRDNDYLQKYNIHSRMVNSMASQVSQAVDMISKALTDNVVSNQFKGAADSVVKKLEGGVGDSIGRLSTSAGQAIDSAAQKIPFTKNWIVKTYNQKHGRKEPLSNRESIEAREAVNRR